MKYIYIAPSVNLIRAEVHVRVLLSKKLLVMQLVRGDVILVQTLLLVSRHAPTVTGLRSERHENLYSETSTSTCCESIERRKSNCIRKYTENERKRKEESCDFNRRTLVLIYVRTHVHRRTLSTFYDFGTGAHISATPCNCLLL